MKHVHFFHVKKTTKKCLKHGQWQKCHFEKANDLFRGTHVFNNFYNWDNLFHLGEDDEKDGVVACLVRFFPDWSSKNVIQEGNNL